MNKYRIEKYAMEKLSLEAFLNTIENSNIELLAAPAQQQESRADYQLFGDTAVIEISGVILRDVPWYYEFFGIAATSTEAVRESLYDAMANPQVKNISFLFDSPGGTVTDVQELADDIAAASAEKHTESFVSGMCCSAAYWLASQTSKITATKTSDIGSIGCYAVAYDTSEMFEKAGVKAHLISSGEHKGAFADGVKFTDENLKVHAELINGIAELFKADVARGRKMSMDALNPLATGRTFLGEAAVNNKLIDAIGRIEDVLFNRKGESSMKIFGKKKEETVSAQPLQEEVTPEENPDAGTSDDTGGTEEPAAAKALIKAFGAEFGAKAIEADMTMSAAKDAFIEYLKEENAALAKAAEEKAAAHADEVTELNKRIEALSAATGEAEPVGASDHEKSPEEQAKEKKVSELTANGMSEAKAKIIANTKLKK